MQPYVEQQPSDIRLSHVEGSFDPNRLTVYKAKTAMFFGGRLEVTASIIGASHVLSFPGFYEVFACAELPDTPCYKLNELEGHPIYRSIPGARYGFQAKQIEWGSKQPKELDNLVWLAQALPFGLICEFEKGTLAVTPITVIVGFEENGQLIFLTGHAYPEDALVLTATRLTLTKNEVNNENQNHPSMAGGAFSPGRRGDSGRVFC
jgi:hypothetical protein